MNAIRIVLVSALCSLVPVTTQSQSGWALTCATCPDAEFSSDVPGTFALSVAVDDGRGGTAVDTVMVTVVDDKPPVIASLTATPNGKGKTYTVTALATDTIGVTRVDFLLDDVFKASVSLPPYTTTVTIKTAGAHTVQARAYDAAGNVALASVVVK